MSTFDRHSAQTRRAIFWAHYDAVASHSECIEPHHLLAGLLFQQPQLVRETLLLSSTPEGASLKLAQHSTHSPEPYGAVKPPLSADSKQILIDTKDEARRMWKEKHNPAHRISLALTLKTWPICAHHLLLALVRHGITQTIAERGLQREELRQKLLTFEEETRGFIPEDAKDFILTDNSTNPVKSGLPLFLQGATFEAMRLGHRAVRPEELLLTIVGLQPLDMQSLLGSTFDLRPLVRDWTSSTDANQPSTEPGMDPHIVALIKAILVESEKECLELEHSEITSRHLLAGILRHGQSFAAEILRKKGLRIEDVRGFMKPI